jgi:hypothetical protein
LQDQVLALREQICGLTSERDQFQSLFEDAHKRLAISEEKVRNPIDVLKDGVAVMKHRPVKNHLGWTARLNWAIRTEAAIKRVAGKVKP